MTTAQATINKNIDVTCKQSPAHCLAQIDNYIDASPLHSRLWFKYKLLQMEAFYLLQKDTELSTNINEWLDSSIPPIIFQAYVDIYYGKILLSKNGNDVRGKKYIQKSLDLLSKINEVIPEPLRFIKLANLLIDSGQFTEAKQILLELETKFLKRKDPEFLSNLYANFASIAYQSHKLEEHIFYRKKSLYWAKQFHNDQQISVAYANLARAQEISKNYVGAVRNYQHAFQYVKQTGDTTNLWNIKFRYVEIITKQEKYQLARKLFKSYFSVGIPKTMTKSYRNNIKVLKRQLEKSH